MSNDIESRTDSVYSLKHLKYSKHYQHQLPLKMTDGVTSWMIMEWYEEGCLPTDNDNILLQVGSVGQSNTQVGGGGWGVWDNPTHRWGVGSVGQSNTQVGGGECGTIQHTGGGWGVWDNPTHRWGVGGVGQSNTQVGGGECGTIQHTHNL